MCRSKVTILLVLSFTLINCHPTIAPTRSVPKRNALPIDAYGGWIDIKLVSSSDSVEEKSFQGELIAVEVDSVYILQLDKVQGLAISEVKSAKIIIFNTSMNGYGIWTFLASLLTLSNGAYAVLTLPVTLITGIATTIGEANRINYIDYPQNDVSELRKFARFPQGMPKDINMATLRSRVE